MFSHPVLETKKAPIASDVLNAPYLMSNNNSTTFKRGALASLTSLSTTSFGDIVSQNPSIEQKPGNLFTEVFEILKEEMYKLIAISQRIMLSFYNFYNDFREAVDRVKSFFRGLYRFLSYK